MRLLDTNIIIYAAGRPHPYKAACARLLQEVASGDSGYNIDTELLQEVLYVYAARNELDLSLATFDSLLTLFPNPVAITRGTMVEARRIIETYQPFSPRDAIHAAVVHTQGMEGLVTMDRVFSQVPVLVCFDPLELYPKGGPPA